MDSDKYSKAEIDQAKVCVLEAVLRLEQLPGVLAVSGLPERRRESS
jgi:hypothetical protein